MSNRPQGARVLMCRLSVRTSARGATYLSGWLGAANVVGFKGEPDQWGNPTYDLFLTKRSQPPRQQTLLPAMAASFADAEVD